MGDDQHPFTTAWLDESDLARTPTVVYGVNLVAAAIAFGLLQAQILRVPGTGERVRSAMGNDLKGKVSPVLYLTGIALAFVSPWLALAPYVTVALIWLVPDRRVERFLAQERAGGAPGGATEPRGRRTGSR
ncbi:hypothetical protein GCM10027596_30850 [Nocardioides korecus]